MLAKQWIIFGAMSSFFGVVFGAFGSHALKDILSEKAWVIYQTAVQYQFIHALALLALGLWATQNNHVNTATPGWAFTVGILFFCGSLYTLALTGLKFMGAVAPIGGVSFLIGWFTFAFLAWKA